METAAAPVAAAAPAAAASAASAQDEGAKRATVTLSFARTAPKKSLDVKAQPAPEKSDRIQIGNATADALAKLTSQKKEVQVIPLIHRNKWAPKRLDEIPPLEGGGGGGAMEGVEEQQQQQRQAQSLEDQAAMELVQAAKEERPLTEDEIKSLPILVQNKPPGIDRLTDEGEKLRHDVSLRPDEPDLDAYERMPIEEIGKGMLYGMGWRPGAPIGLTNKVAVEPIEFLPRAERLGLGAIAVPEHKKQKKFIKPGESREEKQYMRVAPDADGKVRHHRKLSERIIPVHSLRLRVGALIEFEEGQHRGMWGRVTAMLEGQSVVRLNLNGTDVTTPNGSFKVLDEHSLPPDHPAMHLGPPKEDASLPLFAALTKLKEAREQEKHKKRSRSRSPKKGDDKRSKHDSSKKRDRSPARQPAAKRKPVTWVTPGLRVRVISKDYKGGRFYTKKGRVVDCADGVHFSMQMDGGEVADNVTEADVETALPKAGGAVRIVRGEQKGELGKLLERNGSQQKAAVQLHVDLTIAQLKFDDVCEWAGH